jgi:hypothetical protein
MNMSRMHIYLISAKGAEEAGYIIADFAKRLSIGVSY